MVGLSVNGELRAGGWYMTFADALICEQRVVLVQDRHCLRLGIFVRGGIGHLTRSMEKAGICDRLVHTDRRTPALDIGHGHGLRFIEREEIGAGGATSNADQAQSDAASRAFASSIVSITNARSSPTSGRRGERVHSGAP